MDTPDLKEFKAGEQLLRQGEIGRSAYWIVSGKVKVSTQKEDQPDCESSSENVSDEREDTQNEVILAELDEGQYFGEMAVLAGRPRSANVYAITDVVVRELDRDTLLNQLDSNPEVRLKILSRLSDTIRLTNERLLDGNLETQPQACSVLQRLKQTLQSASKTQQVIASYQSDATEMEHAPVPQAVWFSILALIACLGSFLLWGYLAKVDQVITGQGKVVPTVANVMVRAAEGSLIRQVKVEQGDAVEKGDLLAVLDPTMNLADITSTQRELKSISARIIRLTFELAKQQSETLPARSEDDIIYAIESDLYASRLQEYRSQLQIFDQQIKNLQAQNKATRHELSLARKQKKIAKDLEGAYKTLLDKNVGSRVQYLSTRSRGLSLDLNISKLRSNQTNIEADLALKQTEREAYINNRHATIGKELAEARTRQQLLQEQLKKFQWRQNHIRIIAPIAGTVLDLAPGIATGSMIKSGDLLLTLAPSGVPLEVQIDIPAKDISKVKLEDTVSVKLEAYTFQSYGDLAATVRFISADAASQTLFGQKEVVYPARLTLTRTTLLRPPAQFKLIPGMNVTADIKVSERRLITYFIYPIMRWLDESFREP
ncbi:HlyD family type I secretion periplasmic adaptor subunit [Magnetococcales bacterium HHB-1]